MKKLLSLLFMLVATSVAADTIITGSKPFTFIPGTVISSSQVNANFDYIINQTNTNAAKNGVNSSITALLGLTTPIAPNFGGSSIYTSGAAGGTANVITVSTTQPAISSFTLAAGNFVLFVASATNTAATTLNVNATGATAINKTTPTGLTALTGGEIVTGQATLTYYDGTRFVLINQAQLFGAQTNVASAGTTDLALAGSHNVSVTGTTTITSFGSNALTALPIYYVKFAGALTITFNATSMITPSASDILTAAGDSAIIEYLGTGNWQVNQFIRKTTVPELEAVNALVIVNNAGTPTTQVDIDANAAIICTTASYCLRVNNVNLTVNAATTGANALDTGALANNTWYHLYIISNGVTTAGLASTSATTPTMPAGYVYKYRVGAIRTLGAATFVRIRQVGNNAQYIVVAASTTPNLPIMASGNSGSTTVPTWTAIATGTYVPPTAVRVIGSMGAATSGGTYSMMLAPNNSYGAHTSTTNPPPVRWTFGANGDYTSVLFDFVLESTDIFYAAAALSASSPYVLARGWVDAVNAN